MKSSPYAGFDPLREAHTWEGRTRELVLSRLHDVPPRRFFTPGEVRLLDAVVDRLIPQPDRAPGVKVPVTPWIDQMLHDDDTDGFRTGDMPWDQPLWRQALVGFDQTSQARHGQAFVDLPPRRQDDVLAAVQAGQAEGELWQRLDPRAAFSKIVQEVASIYYAHPLAWAEIGWPGPASKRGYLRTGYGQRDPWQPRERTPVSSVRLVTGVKEGAGPSGSAGATH